MPNAVITAVALFAGLAVLGGVIWVWIRFRRKHPAGFDPTAVGSKIETSVVLAGALMLSGFAFFGVLVLLG